MDQLTEELRSALRQEAAGISTVGDMGQAIQHVTLTRRRWAGGISLAVVLLLVGGALTLWRPTAVAPAVPIPAPPVVTSEPSRVLPPICGNPAFAAQLPEPYKDPRPCPSHLPVGPNYGWVSGGHMIRDVVVDIPAAGWTAGALSDSVEVVSPAGNAVTVVAYPSLVTLADQASSAGQLPAMIRHLADVVVRDSGTTTTPGWTFTWMDLAVAPDADLSQGCRSDAPCVPLLRAMNVPGPAVELRPGRVSRVIIGDPTLTENIPVAIWIHDITGPDADTALDVANHLTISEAHE